MFAVLTSWVVGSAVAALLQLSQRAVAAEACEEPWCSYLPCGGNNSEAVVGSCVVLSCYPNHGNTDCLEGTCYCGEGLCAAGDNFTCNVTRGQCQKKVAGSCRGVGEDCGEELGPTDCINGYCVCKEGTCRDDGLCKNATPAVSATAPPSMKFSAAEAAHKNLLEANFSLFGVVGLVVLIAMPACAAMARRWRQPDVQALEAPLLSEQ